MIFFVVQEFFSWNFHFKNECKNEFQDNNENHANDPEIGFLTKSIPKPYDRATVIPPAGELTIKISWVSSIDLQLSEAF